jgi:eukaryotic-like serine/threonine-protein kinase
VHAEAILAKALGPDHPYTAMALFGIGEADVNLGRPAKAIPTLERALTIRAVPGATDPLDLAETKYTLARALWDAKRDRARARTLATEARRLFEDSDDKDAARVVDEWLRVRRN